MVFLVFIRFLYPPPAWKVVLLGQKSSPKDVLSVVVVYAFSSLKNVQRLCKICAGVHLHNSCRIPCATKTLPIYVYPKKFCPNYFEITVARFELSELIKKLPDTLCIVWVAWHYPPKTPVLVELFFITVTQFEVFRIHWVMFSCQVVVCKKGKRHENRALSHLERRVSLPRRIRARLEPLRASIRAPWSPDIGAFRRGPISP